MPSGSGSRREVWGGGEEKREGGGAGPPRSPPVAELPRPSPKVPNTGPCSISDTARRPALYRLPEKARYNPCPHSSVKNPLSAHFEYRSHREEVPSSNRQPWHRRRAALRAPSGELPDSCPAQMSSQVSPMAPVGA